MRDKQRSEKGNVKDKMHYSNNNLEKQENEMYLSIRIRETLWTVGLRAELTLCGWWDCKKRDENL